MSEYVKLVNPNATGSLCYHIYSDLNSDTIEIVLMDCGTATLTRVEMGTVMCTLSSDIFYELVEAINKRNKLEIERDAMYDSVKCGDTEMLYDLCQTNYEYGRACERAYNLREFIIDKIGFQNWVNTTRVYEAFYQIDRGELG